MLPFTHRAHEIFAFQRMPFSGRNHCLHFLDRFTVRHQHTGGSRIQCHRHPLGPRYRHPHDRRDVGLAQHCNKILDLGSIARRMFGVDNRVVEGAAGQDRSETRGGHLRQHATEDMAALLQRPSELGGIHNSSIPCVLVKSDSNRYYPRPPPGAGRGHEGVCVMRLRGAARASVVRCRHGA